MRLLSRGLVSASSRSPPYRFRGYRIRSRRAARANRARAFRHRTAQPSRRDRARPDAGVLAPHDQPDVGGGSVAERHRRAGVGFQYDTYGGSKSGPRIEDATALRSSRTYGSKPSITNTGLPS